MYAGILEEFILVDVVTCCTSGIGHVNWKLHSVYTLYKHMNRHEKCENTIHSHLTQKRSENYIQLRNLGIEI